MARKQRIVIFQWYKSLKGALECSGELTSWKCAYFTSYKRLIESKEQIFAIFKSIFSMNYWLKTKNLYHICLVRYSRTSLGQNFKIFKIIFLPPFDCCAVRGSIHSQLFEKSCHPKRCRLCYSFLELLKGLKV